MPFTPEQRAAIEARNPRLLVSAAAGSGKTAVLIERIASLLQNGEASVDRLLVCTFTRAAAGEMRERLETRLSDAAPGDPRMRRELERLDTAQIGTLHSFCGRVTREFFHAVNVDPQAAVCDDVTAANLLAACVEETLDEAYAAHDPDIDALTERFQDRQLQEMLPQLYHFLMGLPEPFAWLDAQLALAPEDQLRQNGPLSDALRADCDVLLSGAEAFWRQAMRLAEAPLCPDKLPPMLEGDGGLLLRLRDAIEAGLPELIDQLASMKYSRFPTLKLTDEGELSIKARIQALRDSYKKLTDQMKKLLPADPAAAVADMESMRPALRGLAAMARLLHAKLTERKRERALLTFEDTEHMALAVLRDPELAAGVRRRYDAVFVDEYQDISALQDAILTALCGDDVPLFMVGDVKQSIYRFRQAEPALFLDKLRRYSDAPAAPERRISLNRNFRSRENVLDTVNAVFERVMHGEVAEIDYDDEARLYAGLPSRGDPVARLHVLPSQGVRAAQKPGREAALIAAEIGRIVGSPKQTRDGAPDGTYQYKDIAILAPVGKGVSAAVTRALSDAGIPVYSEESAGVMQQDEVLQAVAHLRLMNSRLDDLSLLTVLRSPAFALTEQELADIRLRRPERGASFLDALLAAAGLAREQAGEARDDGAMDAADAARTGAGAEAGHDTPNNELTGMTSGANPAERNSAQIEAWHGSSSDASPAERTGAGAEARHDMPSQGSIGTPSGASAGQTGGAIDNRASDMPADMPLLTDESFALPTSARTSVACAANDASTVSASSPAAASAAHDASNPSVASPATAARIASNPSVTSPPSAPPAPADPLSLRCREIVRALRHERFLLTHQPMGEYLWGYLHRSGMYGHFGAQPGGQLRQANLRLLCHRLDDWERQRGGDLGEFLDSVTATGGVEDRTSPSVLSPWENVVRVMTIHKSKGLEFPIVFLMDMGRALHGRDDAAALSLHPRVGVALRYVNPRARSRRQTLGNAAVALRRRAEETAERARLLYVAMTRARDQLIMVGHMSAKRPANWTLPHTPYRAWEAGSMLDWLCQTACDLGADPERLGEAQAAGEPANEAADNATDQPTGEGRPAGAHTDSATNSATNSTTNNATNSIANTTVSKVSAGSSRDAAHEAAISTPDPWITGNAQQQSTKSTSYAHKSGSWSVFFHNDEPPESLSHQAELRALADAAARESADTATNARASLSNPVAGSAPETPPDWHVENRTRREEGFSSPAGDLAGGAGDFAGGAMDVRAGGRADGPRVDPLSGGAPIGDSADGPQTAPLDGGAWGDNARSGANPPPSNSASSLSNTPSGNSASSLSNTPPSDGLSDDANDAPDDDDPLAVDPEAARRARVAAQRADALRMELVRAVPWADEAPAESLGAAAPAQTALRAVAGEAGPGRFAAGWAGQPEGDKLPDTTFPSPLASPPAFAHVPFKVGVTALCRALAEAGYDPSALDAPEGDLSGGAPEGTAEGSAESTVSFVAPTNAALAPRPPRNVSARERFNNPPADSSSGTSGAASAPDAPAGVSSAISGAFFAFDANLGASPASPASGPSPAPLSAPLAAAALAAQTGMSDDAFAADPLADPGRAPSLEETAQTKRLPLAVQRPRLLGDLPRLPSFLRPAEAQTGLRVGVSTHKALSLLPFEPLRAARAEGPDALRAAIRAELNALAARRRLSPQERADASDAAIAGFFASELGGRALTSPECHREWAFNLRVRAPFDGVVQGVIDLCFLEGDAWVLVDYKTDAVATPAALAARYRPQVSFYRRALTVATGRPVRQAALYSLSLQQAVEV